MDFAEIILIASGLAMDASAVSLAAAASGYAKTARARFRLSFHFGLFQCAMPVLGWLLGISFVSYVSSFDHWIAFVLLTLVGGRMIIAGMNSSSESYTSDPSRGFTLVLLSIATSIDALAIGLSLAVLDVAIWYPSAIIGITTVCFCLLAIRIGQQLGVVFGKRMEIFGGAILILIGLRILLSHLLS